MITSLFSRIKKLLFYALVVFIIWALVTAIHLPPAVILHKVLSSVVTQFTQLFTGSSHLPHIPKPKFKP